MFQEQALATFNFLNSERRYVAGALIPPNYISDTNTDIEFLDEDILDGPLPEFDHGEPEITAESIHKGKENLKDIIRGLRPAKQDKDENL